MFARCLAQNFQSSEAPTTNEACRNREHVHLLNDCNMTSSEGSIFRPIGPCQGLIGSARIEILQRTWKTRRYVKIQVLELSWPSRTSNSQHHMPSVIVRHRISQYSTQITMSSSTNVSRIDHRAASLLLSLIGFGSHEQRFSSGLHFCDRSTSLISAIVS